jgi:hypothetical protein
MSFVDTRLHVSVRPTLEYLVPEVGRTMKRCLLGDIGVAEALPSLECCVFLSREPDLEDEDQADGDANALALRTCMSETIGLMHEYLASIVSSWKEHLETTRAHVGRIAQAHGEERAAAHRARDRFRAQRPEVVEREFSAEVDRILTSLNQSLVRVREADEPGAERPVRLTASCETLRKTFAESYGRLQTKYLIRLKTEFEEELVRVQAGLSEDFVHFCTRMLRG